MLIVFVISTFKSPCTQVFMEFHGESQNSKKSIKSIKSIISCEASIIFVISTSNYLYMQVLRETQDFEFGVSSGAAEVQ
ncbi:hypothetical protein Y032_0100g3295 [Ancylostoma ceylanicum]|uniref:Uncharacterized protein n=1 Tax=Ancylostoma ceylanicum TaxID=53326 RepID=A0A016TIL3_9BILA|nr:hypothetical protein Y032_0100g3295 [Ancylostoma ceylanicum]